MMISRLLELEAVLLLLALLGVFLRKRGMLNDAGRSFLTDLVTDVILPCNIFLSFLGTAGGETLRSSLLTVGMSAVTMLLSAFVGWLVYRRRDHRQSVVFRYATTNSNAIFIGLPIIQSLLGAEGVLQLSMYMIFMRIFIWTYGLSLYTGVQADKRSTFRKLATQPAMVAAYLGFAAMLLPVELPGFLKTTLTDLSNCLMALSMLLVGSVLADIHPRGILRGDVWGFGAVRLLLLPGLTLLLCRALGVPYIVTATCTLICGMPAASLTAVLAGRYKVDAETASLLVALSTVLSIITIPGWYLILQALQ